MSNPDNKYDGSLDRRCWIKISGLFQGENGTHQAITKGRHGGLQNAHKFNASAVIVFKVIDSNIEKLVTCYPNRGNPHREVVDYFQEPDLIGNFEPISDFIKNSHKTNYRVATLTDTQPRAPLEVEHPENNDTNQKRKSERVEGTEEEHTIAHDICVDCKESEYDHLIVAVIRPIVINDADLKPDTSSGIFDTIIFPGLRKAFIDRRSEGNITNSDYYVQLTEIIGYDNTQEKPTTPALDQATDWCDNKHNFTYEFINERKAIKKLQRCQTDVKNSRFRFWLPNIDDKKRAMAVSEDQLKQFTMNVTVKLETK